MARRYRLSIELAQVLNINYIVVLADQDFVYEFFEHLEELLLVELDQVIVYDDKPKLSQRVLGKFRGHLLGEQSQKLHALLDLFLVIEYARVDLLVKLRLICCSLFCLSRRNFFSNFSIDQL